MKTYRIYILISLISAAFIVGVFFAYDSARQNRLKTDATALVTLVSTEVFEMEISSFQVPQSSPPIEIGRREMQTIMSLDEFVQIEVTAESLVTPSLLSSQTPNAHFLVTGHFVRGTQLVEASMVHEDGQWVFKEFVIKPGQRAQ